MQSVIERILINEGLSLPDKDDLAHVITSYNGDLRRVITEIQAALASGASLRMQVNKGLVEYDNILSLIINKEYDKTLTALKNESYKGRSVKEICIGLHDVVEKAKIENEMKYKLYRVIGEAEWRSVTVTPRILFGWMIGQIR